MPVPVLNAKLTTEQQTELNTSIAKVEEVIADVAIINLSPSERQSLQSINNTRLPYVNKVIRELAPANASLIPGFSSLSDAEADLDLAAALSPYVTKLTQLLEKVTDIQILAEHEAYQFFLDFYNSVQQAKERNVPGSDTVYNELKPLFEQSNGGGDNSGGGEDKPNP